ncbi:MAG TPA: hypothetical protein VHY35_08495 [Stellaceae bacterium]|jgi:hypothetical protein|nr:hypothetical protein [Stellaceae bacterium]
MRASAVKSLLAAAVLTVGLAASADAAEPAAAQNPTTSTVPAPQQPTPPQSVCATPPAYAAGGASVVQDADESLQHKSWQARGGEIQFSIGSAVAIPADASVLVCFRWKSSTSRNDAKYVEMRPSRLELSNGGTVLKVTTTVPKNLGKQPADLDSVFPLVSLADVRILATKPDKTIAADAATEIGITYPTVGLLIAGITVALAFLMLHIAANRRLKNYPGIMKANWLLRVIATPTGFASLSQLQIILWTSVVAASAVYVMALSGQLIQITDGVLVLLGISGAAGVGAKVHSESRSATADATAATAAAEHAAAFVTASEKDAAATAATDPVTKARLTAESRVAATTADVKNDAADAAKKRVEGMKSAPSDQVPRWSDLIVNDDGNGTREIDVARFQMLLFTVITAVFVLITVITTYVIPEISTGFQTLMGISNGVYLGSKFAQRS